MSVESARKMSRSMSVQSAAATAVKDKEDDLALDDDIPKVGVWSILKKNKPEWLYILFGCFASIVNGAVMPVFAWLFGEVMGTLSDEPDVARGKSVTFAIAFLVVGVVSGWPCCSR